MCGRFAQAKLDWPSYFELFGDMDVPDLPISFNIKPTQNVAIAFNHDGAIISKPARWWFVPHWHRGAVKSWKATTFNAKIETAHKKPTFGIAWRQNRCIIPATGYYEWTGPKGSKQPHYITVEQNVPVFFFAGLYSTIQDGTRTATIITQDAAPNIAEIHHRMPVILPLDQLKSWMGCEAGDYGWSGGFKHHQVNPFEMKDDGVELVEKIAIL